MKKTLLTLAAALVVGAAAADDRPINYKQLPKAAKSFVEKHFAQLKVISATIDKEFASTDYTVYLEGGAKVEFNKKGEWKEVDCGVTTVPSSVVPEFIGSYVAKNYTAAYVTKIEVDHIDYELKLSNGLELIFDLKGNFIRMDD